MPGTVLGAFLNTPVFISQQTHLWVSVSPFDSGVNQHSGKLSNLLRLLHVSSAGARIGSWDESRIKFFSIQKLEERPPVQRLGTWTLESKSSGSVTFYHCGPGTSLFSLSLCFFMCKMGLWEGTKWDMDAKLITPCLVHYALKDHYYSFHYIHIYWTVTVWMYNSISLM